MLSENAQTLLIQNGWIIQLAAAATVASIFGWLAKKGQPKAREGWQYSYYPVVIKVFAVLFAAFMTAAIALNGMSLFASDWWVPPIIIIMFVGSYWLLYEVFVTQLRWNDERFELRRFPFAAQSLPYSEIVAVRYHATTESLTVVASNGDHAWFPYSYRIGMQDFLSRLRRHNDES